MIICQLLHSFHIDTLEVFHREEMPLLPHLFIHSSAFCYFVHYFVPILVRGICSLWLLSLFSMSPFCFENILNFFWYSWFMVCVCLSTISRAVSLCLSVPSHWYNGDVISVSSPPKPAGSERSCALLPSLSTRVGLEKEKAQSPPVSAAPRKCSTTQAQVPQFIGRLSAEFLPVCSGDHPAGACRPSDFWQGDGSHIYSMGLHILRNWCLIKVGVTVFPILGSDCDIRGQLTRNWDACFLASFLVPWVMGQCSLT